MDAHATTAKSILGGYTCVDQVESGLIARGAVSTMMFVYRKSTDAKRKEEAMQTNNKLREALTKVKEWMELRIVTCGYEFSATLPTMLEDVVLPALVAPPRNCDRFGSSTQARAEWYKTEVLPRVEGVVSGVEPPFVDWLFAPATEKEGGDDGK